MPEKSKKRKRQVREIEQVLAAAVAANRAEGGGSSGALRIGSSDTQTSQPQQQSEATLLRRSTCTRVPAYPTVSQQEHQEESPPTPPRPRFRERDKHVIEQVQDDPRLIDLRRATVGCVKRFRLVPITTWFPEERDPSAGALFSTTIQESFYRAQMLEKIAFKDHKTINIQILIEAVGTEIEEHLTYMPGLKKLLSVAGSYVDEWVRVFFATVWVDPNHEWMQFMLDGQHYRISAQEIRELFGFPESKTRIHCMCYGGTDPPRRSHGGVAPPTANVAALFRPPFGEASRRVPVDLTSVARVLNGVIRRTLLPRVGNSEVLTNIQQWLLATLVSHTEFDVVDFMLCEIEDTVLDGIKARRQLPYAHYLSQIFSQLIDHPKGKTTLDYSGRAFGVYRPLTTVDPCPGARTLDRMDSSDKEYEESPSPPPPMPPQPHDSEAGSSSSAPPVPSMTHDCIAAIRKEMASIEHNIMASIQHNIMASILHNIFVYFDHILQQKGMSLPPPSVQMAAPALLQTSITPAIARPQGQSLYQVSPTHPATLDFTSPGRGVAPVVTSVSQPFPSATQTQSVIVATSATPDFVSATLSQVIGELSQSVSLLAAHVPPTTVAPQTGTGDAIPSSVSLTDPQQHPLSVTEAAASTTLAAPDSSAPPSKPAGQSEGSSKSDVDALAAQVAGSLRTSPLDKLTLL